MYTSMEKNIEDQIWEAGELEDDREREGGGTVLDLG